MKRVVRSWLVQQAHKRVCTCPTWWQLELYNVLMAMFLEIIDEE